MTNSSKVGLLAAMLSFSAAAAADDSQDFHIVVSHTHNRLVTLHPNGTYECVGKPTADQTSAMTATSGGTTALAVYYALCGHKVGKH